MRKFLWLRVQPVFWPPQFSARRAPLRRRCRPRPLLGARELPRVRRQRGLALIDEITWSAG